MFPGIQGVCKLVKETLFWQFLGMSLGIHFFHFQLVLCLGMTVMRLFAEVCEDKVCHKILAHFNAFATEFPLQI